MKKVLSILLILVLITPLYFVVFENRVLAAQPVTFIYTGSPQTFTPSSKDIQIEVWGAQGGDSSYSHSSYSSSSGWSGYAYMGGEGGLGGYTKTTIHLSSLTPLTIYVGGVGSDENNDVFGYSNIAGGFGYENGGDSKGYYYDGSRSFTSWGVGSGGGSSAVLQGSQVLVSGGGGGGAWLRAAGSSYVGGDGGGPSGGYGATSTRGDKYYYDDDLDYSGRNGLPGTGQASASGVNTVINTGVQRGHGIIKITELNTEPMINSISSPTANQAFSEAKPVTASIVVSDPDNNALTFKYYIDTTLVDTKSIASNTATPQTVSFNVPSMSTITEGSHTVKFEVNDGQSTVQSTVNIIVDKSGPTLGNITPSSDDKSITVTGTASDSSGLSSNPYRYTVGNKQSAWTSLTSFTESSLAPNTSYPVKFEAKDSVDNIRASTVQNFYTKAQVPSIEVGYPTTTSLDITLTDINPSNTQYQIVTGAQYVSSNGTLTSIPQWITLSGKSKTVTGLASNKSYSFQVKARNGASVETALSASKSGTTLPASPQNINKSATNTSITLSWGAVAGAAGYEIDFSGTLITNITSTIYTKTGLTPNTPYTMKVRAKSAAGVGDWSSLITEWTLPNPPSKPLNVDTVPAINSITISWSSVANAAGYDIQADGNIIDNGALTTYVHSSLLPQTQHTYSVRAKNSGGTSNWSSEITQSTLPNPPAIPLNINAVSLRDSITLTWDSTPGATGYEVEADGNIIDNASSNTFVQSSLIPNTEHTYRVRAKNAGGASSWSALIKQTTLPNPPSTPFNINANASNTEIKVVWDAVVYATGYEIEVDGEIKDVGNIMGYVHSGLNSEEQHVYRVRAKNAGGESEWSAALRIMTLPNITLAMTNVTAVVKSTSVFISWDAVAPEADYDIEVDGVVVNNAKDTVYNHTGLQPNTPHTYRVKVKMTTGKSDWCAILNLSTLPNPPDAPKEIRTYVSSNRIDIGWDEVTGATGYEIEVDGFIVDNQTRTLYVHENLMPGTQHIYRIRAKNIGGETAWSQPLKVSTISPAYAVSSTKDMKFNLAITASHIQDFSQRSFVITYDPDQVEIVDLYKETPRKETDSGEIPYTNLTVSYSPGKIVFTVSNSIQPGKSWSGVISTIVFKSKMDGQLIINYKTE